MAYLRRATGMLCALLAIAALIVGLVIVTFFEAMNVANIQIVLKGGMAYRVQTIMGMDTENDRGSFFTASLMEEDPAHGTMTAERNAYTDYNVRGIDHRLDMDFVWVWPQQREVTVTVTESVPRIDGRAKGSRAEALVQAGGADAVYPPAWTDARYRVTLVQDPQTKQWRITRITMIQ
jgi:hypothetical protein